MFETDATNDDATSVPTEHLLNDVSLKTYDVGTKSRREQEYPPLRLNDRPSHLNDWMTDGGFKVVGTSVTGEEEAFFYREHYFVNASRKNFHAPHDALRTVMPQYHGNDRPHGRYTRRNGKMCEIFISRLVPETTVRNVNNFLRTRLNRTVKTEQLGTKYNEYSSFKLCVPIHLKNKVLDKNFSENENIYVRNFVQKPRH